MSDSLRYLSTRGGVTGASFEDVLLAGLAPDGGLFVPESWPMLTATDFDDLAGGAYPDVVTAVAARFVGDTFDAAELRSIVEGAYSAFSRPEIAPLTDLGDNLYLLELYWGPTFSFKDFAFSCWGP